MGSSLHRTGSSSDPAPLSSDTIMAVPRPLENPRTCSTCGAAPGSLDGHGKLRLFRRCARCKEMDYCSEKCQRRHWEEGHRSACGREACCSPNDTLPAAAQISDDSKLYRQPVRPRSRSASPSRVPPHHTSPPGSQHVLESFAGQHLNPFRSAPSRQLPANWPGLFAPRASALGASNALLPSVHSTALAGQPSSPRGILRENTATRELEQAWQRMKEKHVAPHHVRHVDWRSSVRIL